MSAERRIRELKDGITTHYQTKVIEDPYNVVKEISRLIAGSNEINTCLTSGGMHYCHNYFLETRTELLDKQKKGDHKGVRYITNIDEYNVKFANIRYYTLLRNSMISIVQPTMWNMVAA